MKIRDLYDYENDLYIDPRLDIDKILTPVYSKKDIKEDTIYILPRPLNRNTYPKIDEPYPYAIITGKDFKDDDYNIPRITVENPRRCASVIFSKEYGIDYEKLKVIGITGTNGKTTTAEMIYSILRATGAGVGFIGTGEIRINEEVISDKNYSMTTPDPDVLYRSLKLMQDGGCEYAVMEVSSHSLALSKVSPIKFKCALFTNLSEEHMDFHTDIEDYFATKMTLFDQAECGIFNLDDPYSARASKLIKIPSYTVGVIDSSGDAHIVDYKSKGLFGSSFYYKETGLIFGVDLSLSGTFNVYNALMAIRATISLGVKPCVVKNAIKEIKSVRGRMHTIKEKVTVVIDYAHTAEALRETLYFLKSTLIKGQKLITVVGCGGERDKTKRPIMGKIAESLSDFVIITEDNSRSEEFNSIANMITRGMSGSHHKIIESREDAIETAILGAEENDVVAIIGKGHEKYIIDKNGKRDFDEEKIVKSALEKRRLKDEN